MNIKYPNMKDMSVCHVLANKENNKKEIAH